MLGEDRVEDWAKLTEVLILVEDNRQTSASRSGLEKRAANLNRIVVILLDVLGLSEGELEYLYREQYREQLIDDVCGAETDDTDTG